MRIKLCFVVGKNGVLQAGNNVFDAKIIPRVNSKNLFGGDTLKLFYQKVFEQF